jgi:hypothetical protein
MSLSLSNIFTGSIAVLLIKAWLLVSTLWPFYRKKIESQNVKCKIKEVIPACRDAAILIFLSLRFDFRGRTRKNRHLSGDCSFLI